MTTKTHCDGPHCDNSFNEGGYGMQGSTWLRLERVSSTVSQWPGPWHFCSIVCLDAWATRRHEEQVRDARARIANVASQKED